MSASPVANVPAVNPPNGLAFLSGRIRGARTYKSRNGLVHCTLIVLPAADEFTAPAVVEVESNSRLGQPGDTLTKIRVQITGRARGYQTKDGEQVSTAELRLTLVE